MQEQRPGYERHLFVCTNRRDGGRVCCAARGSEALREKLKAIAKDLGVADRVRVAASGCLGPCEAGINVLVEPDDVWYSGVTEGDVAEIVERYLRPFTRSAALPKEGER